MVLSCSTTPVGKIKDYSDYEAFRPVLEDYTETKNVDSLIEEAIAHNDEESLKVLFSNIHSHYKLHKYYYYLKIIANKNQSSLAYYYLYSAIADHHGYEAITDSSIHPIDSCTKSLALYFLSKAYELGDGEAEYIFSQRYIKDENIPPLEEFRKKVCW